LWSLGVPGVTGARLAKKDLEGSKEPASLGPADLYCNEKKGEDASATARTRCGFQSVEEVAEKCHACDGAKNKFAPFPSKEQHLQREIYNYCPKGDLQPLEGKFHHLLHPTKLYHYVDEACNCWTMLQIAESVFHNPLKFYKFVRINEDCSSMEVVVPRSALQDDCSLDTSAQQGGSFNFFDPGYDKVKHTEADVLPCAEFGTDYVPPEKPCRPLEEHMVGEPSSWYIQGTPPVVKKPIATPVETPEVTLVEAPMETPVKTPEETSVEKPVEPPEETPVETPEQTPEVTPEQTEVEEVPTPGTPKWKKYMYVLIYALLGGICAMAAFLAVWQS